MADPNHAADQTTARSVLIHREIFQLGVLILIAVGAFLVTRAVAANNRDMSLKDAAELYRRGQYALREGRIEESIESFRRATVKNRVDQRYVLALAHGLELKGDTEGARALLLALRESAPEDPDINLQLARLAAARSDVTEALRFYHNALYAPWTPEQSAARRGIRFELIRFLVTHDQASRADSELLALTSDLPDDTELRLEAGRLFTQAGDYAHALDQFQRVLRLAPENGEALAGAGRAAFQLGDYVLARTYLRRAPDKANDIAASREIVDLVLSNDPLVNRLGSSERRRRLVANLAYARGRLNSCLEKTPGVQTDADAMALQSEAEALDQQLKLQSALEQDTVESGVDLIDRVERLVVQKCGPATTLDQALVLIGRRHGS